MTQRVNSKRGCNINVCVFSASCMGPIPPLLALSTPRYFFLCWENVAPGLGSFFFGCVLPE